MEKPTEKVDVTLAYRAGRSRVFEMPRWRFFLLVLLGIVVENVVRGWLVAKYSLPRSEATFYATIAVALYGLIAAGVLAFSSRKQRP
jgi:hypothetical protein